MTATASGSSSVVAVLKPVKPSIATTWIPSRQEGSRSASQYVGNLSPCVFLPEIAQETMGRQTRGRHIFSIAEPSCTRRPVCAAGPPCQSSNFGSGLRGSQPLRQDEHERLSSGHKR